MRHGVAGRKLNKTSSHRKALFRNLAKSLIDHEKIVTTLAKAKEMRRYIEPLITLAKEDTLARRRLVTSRLSNSAHTEMLVRKLFQDLAPRYKNRAGGYTRVIKLGRRRGDAGESAILELVDRNMEIEKNKIAKRKARKESTAEQAQE